MEMLDHIDIYDVEGHVIMTALIEEGSKVSVSLMESDTALLKFSSDKLYRFTRGCYCLIPSLKNGEEGKRYVVCSNFNPNYNEETGGYDYELQLNSWYYAWDRYLLCLNPLYGAVQSSFSYTGFINEHLSNIVKQLHQCKVVDGDKSVVLPSGFVLHYNGRQKTYDVDGSNLVLSSDIEVEPVQSGTNDEVFLLKDVAKSISYENVTIISAIGSICDEAAFNCEWWVEGSYIHFGRCEYGESVKLERNVEIKENTRTDSAGEYGTRLVAFGSKTNIPARYRKKLVFQASNVHTKNGYTFFTDVFRKAQIRHNKSTKHRSLFATASVPHSQTDLIAHEYMDVMSDRQPDSIMPYSVLGRKTTQWQKREYYDCIVQFAHGGWCKIYKYHCNGGELFKIQGTPVTSTGHYIYRFDYDQGQTFDNFGTFVNKGEEIGELDIVWRAPDTPCTLMVSVSGTISVQCYDSEMIAYHRVSNIIDITMPRGKYIVNVEGLEMDYRINEEYVGKADQRSSVEVECFDTTKFTIDVINNSAEYVDTPQFDIEVYREDYWINTPISFISGNKEGQRTNCYLNVTESSISSSNKQALANEYSDDSFVVAIYGTNTGLKNGDLFTIDGYDEANVPISYFTDDYDNDSVLASYERRLMLPVNAYPKNYIDSHRIMDVNGDVKPHEVVTIVKCFDDIYPSRAFSVAKVDTYEESISITEDDGSIDYTKALRYRMYLRKSDIDFKKAYITGGETLKCIFQEGSLVAGFEFDLEFDGNSLEKDEDGNALQVYRIVNYDASGVDIPNEKLYPKEGDSVVLINYTPSALTDAGFITEAENRLKTAAEAYLDRISLDSGLYDVKLLPEYVCSLLKGGNGLPVLGQKIALNDNIYFDEERPTRVIGYEYCLDIPYDSPTLKLGESLKYSRFKEIEKKLNK